MSDEERRKLEGGHPLHVNGSPAPNESVMDFATEWIVGPLVALDTYNIFDCHDYARIELRVDKDGNPFVIEVNPNPSINREDCIPACAELIGMKYEDFIEHILKSAIARYHAYPPYYHLQSSVLAL